MPAASPTEGAEPGPGSRRQLLIVCGVTLLVLLPFVGKPFNIDETLFLRAARQIQEHPLDPYGCQLNWYGWDQPLYAITKNPPLASYLIAAWAWAFGWSEIALHLCFVLVGLAAATGTYALACRFSRRPLVAALLAVSTPAFLISATSVMCDVLMLACWCWAIEFWFRGLDTGRSREFVASSLLIVAAALSKYFGICLIPFLAVVTVMQKRSIDGSLLWLALSAMLLGAYEIYTLRLYGRGLIGAARAYSNDNNSTSTIPTMDLLILAFVYVGGCMVTLLMVLPFSWSLRGWMAFAFVLLVAFSGFLHLESFGGLRVVIHPAQAATPTPGTARAPDEIAWSPLLHFIVFASAGVCLLAMAVLDSFRRRDVSSLFLCLWLLGTWVFAVRLNWTINGRSILPAAPVVGILAARQVDYRARLRALKQKAKAAPEKTHWLLAPALATALAFSMFVAWGDFELASMQYTAVKKVLEFHADSRAPLRFWAHWGFQYYMEKAGAKPWDYTADELQPGDWIAFPLVSGSASGNDDGGKALLAGSKVLHAVDVTSRAGVTTLAPAWPASFYVIAPVPFAIGPVAPDRYVVVTPTRPLPPPRRGAYKPLW